MLPPQTRRTNPPETSGLACRGAAADLRLARWAAAFLDILFKTRFFMNGLHMEDGEVIRP